MGEPKKRPDKVLVVDESGAMEWGERIGGAISPECDPAEFKRPEAHPLAALAESTTARGFLEISMKGGPDSAFIEIELPVAEALERGLVVYGPEKRYMLAPQIAALMTKEDR